MSSSHPFPLFLCQPPELKVIPTLKTLIPLYLRSVTYRKILGQLFYVLSQMTSVYCLHSILRAVWGRICLGPHFLVCSSTLSIILHYVRVEFQDEQNFRSARRNDLIQTLTWPQGIEAHMGQSYRLGPELLNIFEEERRLLLLTAPTLKMLQNSGITSESNFFTPQSPSFSYRFLQCIRR